MPLILKREGFIMVDKFNETSTFDKVSERLNQIQSAMENISSSEEFKQYLAVMGKFYDYSLNNSILIALQNPNATHVAGYNQWQSKFERHVKKDEKGIEILAPASGRRHTIQKTMLDDNQLESFLKGEPIIVVVKDKNNGKDYSFSTSLSRFKQDDIPLFLEGKRIREEQGYTWFKPVKVFDVSQTEGKELPKNPIQVNELKGEVKNFDLIMNAIQKVSPCKIEFAKEADDSTLQKGAKGYYSLAEKRIVVKEGMSELQTIKTAIHEAAHAMLHNDERINKIPLENRPDRRDKEIQAESVACAACYYFGLDTAEYSFGYVAGWASANVEKFKESMKLIRETSSEIITAIDKELYPEKSIQLENDKGLKSLDESSQNKENVDKTSQKSKSKSKSKAWTPSSKKQKKEITTSIEK